MRRCDGEAIHLQGLGLMEFKQGEVRKTGGELGSAIVERSGELQMVFGVWRLTG